MKNPTKESYTVGDVYQISIERGDSFSLYVTFMYGATAIDLTGYTAELLDSNLEAIDGSATIPTPSNGKILVQFTSYQTLTMLDKSYRLRIVQGGTVTTLLEGRIDVS